MTVTKQTISKFELELDGDDQRILEHLSDIYGQEPEQVIHEIVEQTFQLARDKYISDLR